MKQGKIMEFRYSINLLYMYFNISQKKFIHLSNDFAHTVGARMLTKIKSALGC